MTGAPFLVLFALLQQPNASATVEEVPAAPAPEEPTSDDSGLSLRLALEVGPLSFPSGTPDGGQDGFALALPILRIDGGEEFAFELGAPLRFRLLDEEPKQTANDYGAHLRREDWDTPSDVGQIVRELRIGSEAGRFFLRAGQLVAVTLGNGHLVERYSNQLSPDYHPAGAVLIANIGSAHVEALASDVLARRLFAADVRWDLGRLFSTDATKFDRYHLTVAAAHDFGRVGETRTEAITAAHVGVDAALYRGESLEVFALAGGGTRMDVDSQDLGGFFGLAVRKPAGDVEVSGRLEGRYQGGSFRFGLFGPAYELSRFSATGLSQPPLAEERLERHFSGYGELNVTLISGEPEGLDLSLGASGEYFAFGRVDADISLAFLLPGGRTKAAARAILTGLGVHPRYAVSAELRQRLVSSFYVWGSMGSVFFPQPEGHLVNGFTAGAGVGLDFVR